MCGRRAARARGAYSLWRAGATLRGPEGLTGQEPPRRHHSRRSANLSLLVARTSSVTPRKSVGQMAVCLVFPKGRIEGGKAISLGAPPILACAPREFALPSRRTSFFPGVGADDMNGSSEDVGLTSHQMRGDYSTAAPRSLKLIPSTLFLPTFKFPAKNHALGR